MSCDYQHLPHYGIQTLQPYVPGKSCEELAKEQNLTEIIKLASNENPLGCSPKVREALADLSGIQIATYPAPAMHPLKNKLCAHLNINENMLTLCNGSDTLFSLLLITFGLHTNKTMLTHDKAFMSYAIQAQTLGIPYEVSPLKANWEVDIPALINACTSNTALIFLANPNNPTGVLIPPPLIKELLDGVPESTLVVIDEAYYEYAYNAKDGAALTLLSRYPNLIITRTFSKAYGMAGLRLGYAIAHPAITELLLRVQPPFVVNQAALTAADAALNDREFLAEALALNIQGMQQLQEGLESLGCKTIPSHGNFIAFDCGMNSLPIYEGLLRNGVIVRPLSAYGLNNFLRVSSGKILQNAFFLDKLAQVFSEIR